jgi:DNA repair ATPase RecN
MLGTLRIKNLAVVSDLTLELQPGLNILTGETGAGKSIVIGALNLILGQRADRTLIRGGAESCTVEAVFDTTKLKGPFGGFLEENGIEPADDGQLLIRRAFTAGGQNRQFVNGSPTTLQILEALGEFLVDIHGPHDHQSLLHSARQLAILHADGSLDRARLALPRRAARLLVSTRYVLRMLKVRPRRLTTPGLAEGRPPPFPPQHRTPKYTTTNPNCKRIARSASPINPNFIERGSTPQ